MVPLVGSSNPPSSRSVVVFPQPDGPSRLKNSPPAMSRSRSLTAGTAPYRLVRPRTRMLTPPGRPGRFSGCASPGPSARRKLKRLLLVIGLPSPAHSRGVREYNLALHQGQHDFRVTDRAGVWREDVRAEHG
jgi:hypothetical protein